LKFIFHSIDYSGALKNALKPWISSRRSIPPQSNLLQRGGKTLEELLSGAPFLLEVALVDSATK
jgi:hypothetical protein